MSPIRPLTFLRLKKLWPHARKKGHEIGDIWRVGYYRKRDGLKCIWLVDKDGVYARTADPEWVVDKFEVIKTSDEKSLYGQNRPPIGPLIFKKPASPLVVGDSKKTTKAKPSIPWRNRSPHGWWIGSYIERFEFNDEKRDNPKRRCLAHENTMLLKAKNRDEAYRKLIKLGSGKEFECVDNASGKRGFWRFEGPSLLLPIYDELEHGAELLWTVHRNRPVHAIQSRVRTKNNLPVFDDSE